MITPNINWWFNLQQKQFDIPEIGVLTVLWATVDTLLNTTKEGTIAARQIRQTSQQTQFWWKSIKIFVHYDMQVVHAN